ncbi:MAG: tetratricopeptide repeat protein [Chloroflexota bacterium]
MFKHTSHRVTLVAIGMLVLIILWMAGVSPRLLAISNQIGTLYIIEYAYQIAGTPRDDFHYEQAILLREAAHATHNEAWRTSLLQHAIARYDQALLVTPKGAATIYIHRGTTYRDLGNLDAAIADYTAALEDTPNVAIAFSNRGLAYQEQGNLCAALSDYHMFLERSQNDPSRTTQFLQKVINNKIMEINRNCAVPQENIALYSSPIRKIHV